MALEDAIQLDYAAARLPDNDGTRYGPETTLDEVSIEAHELGHLFLDFQLAARSPRYRTILKEAQADYKQYPLPLPDFEKKSPEGKEIGRINGRANAFHEFFVHFMMIADLEDPEIVFQTYGARDAKNLGLSLRKPFPSAKYQTIGMTDYTFYLPVLHQFLSENRELLKSNLGRFLLMKNVVNAIHKMVAPIINGEDKKTRDGNPSAEELKTMRSNFLKTLREVATESRFANEAKLADR